MINIFTTFFLLVLTDLEASRSFSPVKNPRKRRILRLAPKRRAVSGMDAKREDGEGDEEEEEEGEEKKFNEVGEVEEPEVSDFGGAFSIGVKDVDVKGRNPEGAGSRVDVGAKVT